MRSQKLREKLYDQYGREIVDRSLSVWNALNKATERDNSLSGMERRAKSPSDAWTLLKSIVESDDSTTARENA